MKMKYWIVLFFINISLSVVCDTWATENAPKPNIIVILADDLGFADVGFNGCKDIPTPNLDQLAKSGVKCTNGYVTHPFCSPTRAALLSGRYQQRFGHETNPVFDPADEISGLPTNQVTLADTLKSAGYQTIHIGKWHLGAAPKFHPLKRGFTYSFGFLGGGHQYFPELITVTSPAEKQAEYKFKLHRNNDLVEIKDYLTDTLSNEAVIVIKENKSSPFFMYLAYNAPHTPLQASDKYLNRFQHIKNEKRRTYAAMISAVDDGVGMVIKELETLGLTQSTMIYFLSDNGGPISVNASLNDPFRGAKGQVYDGGIHVPFVVSWPGHLPEQSVYEQPVSSLDIYATSAAVSGATVPQTHKLDGVNLVPYLLGENKTPPHETLFFRTGGGVNYAARMGDYKLVELKAGDYELYNLKSDVCESTNIATKEPSILADLVSKKEAWNKELVAPAFPGISGKKK